MTTLHNKLQKSSHESSLKIFLVNESIQSIKNGLKEYREDPVYAPLFFGGYIPPHILQPLKALNDKLACKPLYDIIESVYGVTDSSMKRILLEYVGGASELLNMENIRKVQAILRKYKYPEHHKSEIIQDILNMHHFTTIQIPLF